MNTRDRKPLVTLLAAALVALAGSSLVALVGRQDDDLPKEEAKLLERANAAYNEGRWQEADRAYRKFIQEFPKSQQIETAYLQLAYTHEYYSNRPGDARDVLLEFIAKFPQSQQVWNARFQLGYVYQRLNQKDEAKEIFRQIIKESKDAGVRTQAIHQYWSLENKQFYLYVQQSFTAGQEAQATVNVYNVKSAKFRAYRIGYEPLVAALEKEETPDLRQALAKVADRKLLKEWTEDFKDAGNWGQHAIKFGATEPGVYVLEGEHDEITLAVTMFVAKNGIVTKAAAGKLLVFAQDRATGKPVAGMKIRVLNKDARCEGETDATGVFVTDTYKGGVVVGAKDGEVVSSQSWYGEAQQEHPVTYVATDRPVYRPNHTVHFRVVHRTERGDTLKTAAGLKVKVTIHDPKGNVVYGQPHALNEFGTAHGALTLGDEPPLGVYTIQVGPEAADPNRPWEAEWDYPWWLYQVSPQFGQFRVEEYRKPEYKVEVKFAEPRYLQGDTVKATVQADYYFGSPVVDAEVQYTVYQRPHGSYWMCWDYYYDWYLDDEERQLEMGRWWGWGIGQQVLTGTGKTDKEGRFKLSFEAKKLEQDSVYTVVAKVTDLSRRTVDGSGAIKATRSEFQLAANASKYVYKPGERANLKVRAQYPDETPAKPTDVALKVYRHWWRDGRSGETPLFDASSRTDDHGICEFDFTPAESGHLHVVLTSTDQRGNEVKGESWVWVGDGWEDVGNLNGVDILPDRKTYSPGDTASILLTSQYKNISVLVTIEGKEIYRHEVVQIKGHAKLVELKLDRAEYAPNVFVGVTAIKENSYIQKTKSIIVNPSHRFVNVKVTADRKTYRPREKARYTVETTGLDGKPVAAEVALGIVDESIYAIQPEYAQDIRKHFVHRRWPQVATNCSLYAYDWGQATEGEEQAKGDAGIAPPAPGSKPGDSKARAETGASFAEDAVGGGGGTYAATETRSVFADTMFWAAEVRTDASGRAEVEIAVPDNLTTWRATARAVTADQRFGQETSSVVARKNVIVRLELPRFLTQNDESLVTAVAHSYLQDDKEFKIALEVEGLEVTGDLSQKVKIEANGQKRLDWKAKAKTAGAAKVTVKLLSDVESDAMQLTIPVRAHGSPMWKSTAGLLDGRHVEKIAMTKEMLESAGDVLIVVSPTHAATVIDALDYLVGYPYGCVEQTMSRFLPCVVVSQAIQKLGLDKPAILKELPRMVETGLQRLYNFQHPDGGWGWWQHDASAPPTTAYVMIGLALARGADHPVDDSVFARGVAALRHQLTAEKTNDDVRAYILYALSLCGVKDGVARAKVADDAGRLSAYAKALLALVLVNDGQKDEAKRVVALLEKDAQSDGARAFWKGGRHWGWFDHQMEITAAVLRAFLAVDPKNPIVAKAVTWLSSVREGNCWASTKQTALVVQALCEYIAATGDANPDMTISLAVNGDKVFSERVTKANWQKFQGTRRIPARNLNVGDNEITLEKTGSGMPIWSIYVKTYSREENIRASEGGITVSRRYGKVVYAGGQRTVEALDDGGTVRSGDEIEVTLEVTADRNYEYLMLDDPLPAGFEPIREYVEYGYWSWWYARKEFRDDRVSVAMTHMGQGRQQIQYVMRAETPGDLHVLPARVWNMYHAEVGGNSAETRIKVVDR